MRLRRTPDQSAADLSDALGDRRGGGGTAVDPLDPQRGHFTPAEAAEREHEHQDAVLVADFRDRILRCCVGQPVHLFWRSGIASQAWCTRGSRTPVVGFFGDPAIAHSQLEHQGEHAVDVAHRRRRHVEPGDPSGDVGVADLSQRQWCPSAARRAC